MRIGVGWIQSPCALGDRDGLVLGDSSWVQGALVCAMWGCLRARSYMWVPPFCATMMGKISGL